MTFQASSMPPLVGPSAPYSILSQAPMPALQILVLLWVQNGPIVYTENLSACGNATSHIRKNLYFLCCCIICWSENLSKDNFKHSLHYKTRHMKKNSIATSISTALSRFRHLILHGNYIPTDYYVFDDINTVYISIPKVACTSIKTACLARYATDESDVNDQMGIHSAANKYRSFSLNSRQEEYFVFAFVRNPFDRIVSCYEDKVRKEIQHSGQYHFSTNYNNAIIRKLYGRAFHPEMSFREFVKLVADIPDYLSDGHFRSQYSFLYRRGKVSADYIGKFESIQEDWQPIAKKLGLPELSQRNTSNRQQWRDYYTDAEIVNLVAQRYKNDVECFDYSTELTKLRDSIFSPA